MNHLGLFIGVSLLVFSDIYVWSILLKEKINFKNPWFYFSGAFLVPLVMFTHLYTNAFIRIVIVSVFFIFCSWMMFKKKINAIIISTLYTQLLLTISDLLGAILLMLIYKCDTDFIKNTFFDTFLANFIVAFLYVLIVKIPFIQKLYDKLVELTEKLKFKNLTFISLLLIISLNFLMALIYYKLNSFYIIIINTLLLVIYSIILYKTVNEKNSNIIIRAENVSLMESLHQYEDMVDRQRVDNHENKNQLLIIKNMIKKNDKDVIKYIDTVVKDEKEDDEALYTKVKSIPSGGLQGIIYQKMLSMKDNRILFSLDVSRDVRHIDLEKMNMEDNYKLCKIVGVLLDNAIEESLKIDDKRIMISLYVDDDMLVIDISNRFDGKIDLEKIDDTGYTTKGDGHGYGLSLVKKLVSGNACFINERKINKDIFKQIIKFKIK